MSGETDLIKLYSGRILALAADIPHLDRLDDPQATVKRRSPLCGSTVTVDLSVSDGRVSAFGQDVKACALGQAAASVVGSAIIGCTRAQIETARTPHPGVLAYTVWGGMWAGAHGQCRARTLCATAHACGGVGGGGACCG